EVGFDGGNPLFDRICLDRVEEKSGCGTSVVFDRVHHSIQSVPVAAPTQTSVITLLCKASSDISTDTRTRAYHQTNRFHVRSPLQSSAIFNWPTPYLDRRTRAIPGALLALRRSALADGHQGN